MKVAFLIPSKGENWKRIEESILYRYTLNSFIPEPDHKYIFYIGYDNGDSFYSSKNIQNKFKSKFSKFDFKFIEFPTDLGKGHLTRMWNILFMEALTDKKHFIEYFYQCGDDILFKSKGWVQDAINYLKSHENVGATGPRTEHPYLLTQLMVSRVHYEIFQWFFPEYILNWGCDDWINAVYLPRHLHILKDHFCLNSGGPPRYETKNYHLRSLKQQVAAQANMERVKLNFYLKKIHSV